VSLLPLGSGLTVTVLRESVSGRDPYGNDTRTPAETAYSGCAVWPGTTVEDAQGRTTVTTGRTVLFPDAADVVATDKVRLADGTVWRVEGDPAQHVSPITGARGGVLVVLQRVTG
jgi:hypothetical protein